MTVILIADVRDGTLPAYVVAAAKRADVVHVALIEGCYQLLTAEQHAEVLEWNRAESTS